MASPLIVSGPGDGFWPDQEAPHRVFTRVAVTRGDLMMLDLSNSDTDVDNNTPGSIDSTTGQPDSGFNNIVNPTAATPPAVGFEAYNIFCIVLADASADTFVNVMFRGRVDAFVHTTGGGSAAAGNALVADSTELNALTYDAVAETANKKVLAIAMAVVTTPTTPTLGTVLFDGINGFGSIFTETAA